MSYDEDTMFYSYEQEEVKENEYKLFSVEQVTDRFIRVFMKEKKDTIINDLKSAYSQDFSNEAHLYNFYDIVGVVKQEFNIFFMDVYNDHSYIRNNMTEKTYLRYANKALNTVIKDKIFK